MSELAAPSAPATASRPVLSDKSGQFRQHYNTAPFMFQHGLAGHELFELPSLMALARRMTDHRDTYWSNGKPGLTDRWEKGRDGGLSLLDTMAGIAGNDSMVILKHTEQDPVFAPVLQGFLRTVVELAGDAMRQDVVVGEVLILLSSPNRLTPYHIDAETNYLVQVTGNKTCWVFDHTDRTLVTHQERERYFAGDHNAAAFREGRQGEAQRFELLAGNGVHIPVFAPHWVQNHDNVSVALSVNYELRSIARMGDIHMVNRQLRRLGLQPSAPGQPGWRDGLKLALAGGVTRLRGVKGAPPAAGGWTPASPA